MRWPQRRARTVRIAVAVLLLMVAPAIALAAVGVPPAPPDPVPLAPPIAQVGIEAGVTPGPTSGVVPAPAAGAPPPSLAVPRRATAADRGISPALHAATLPATRVWVLLVVAVLGSVVLSVVHRAQGGAVVHDLTRNG